MSVKCESAIQGHPKYRNIRATKKKLVMPKITRVRVEILSEKVCPKLQLSIVHMTILHWTLQKKQELHASVCPANMVVCVAMVVAVVVVAMVSGSVSVLCPLWLTRESLIDHHVTFRSNSLNIKTQMNVCYLAAARDCPTTARVVGGGGWVGREEVGEGVERGRGGGGEGGYVVCALPSKHSLVRDASRGFSVVSTITPLPLLSLSLSPPLRLVGNVFLLVQCLCFF